MIKGLTNTGPPAFESTLVSFIKVVVGNPSVYQMPNYSDPDNDPVDIFLEFMTTRHFCTFLKGKLTFNPQLRDIGNYKIKIILKDKN